MPHSTPSQAYRTLPYPTTHSVAAAASGQGESTPKARPKGVVDGKQVNIPVLGVTAKGGRRRLC